MQMVRPFLGSRRSSGSDLSKIPDSHTSEGESSRRRTRTKTRMCGCWEGPDHRTHKPSTGARILFCTKREVVVYLYLPAYNLDGVVCM